MRDATRRGFAIASQVFVAHWNEREMGAGGVYSVHIHAHVVYIYIGGI